MEVRLQKFMANSGLCSRRKAEEKILEGRVSVNKTKVTQLGIKIDPENDLIEVDGRPVGQNMVEKIYIVLNKPRGVMTTLSDPEGRKTIMDFCKDVPERIYPVGRLDYLSEGLIILTNDGELTNLILHPRYEISKTYEVKVFGAITQKMLTELRRERQFKEGKVRPLSVRVIKQLAGKTWLEFRLGEGRNREIRRICEEVGLTIDKLKRISIEGLSVEGIRPGTYRYIKKRELMKRLNLTETGEKIHGVAPFAFQSSKKTVNLKKKGAQPTTQADDRVFNMFRKDKYYESLESIKKSKAQAKEKAEAAAKAEAKEKYQGRYKENYQPKGSQKL